MRTAPLWPSLLLVASACNLNSIETDSSEFPIINGESCDASELPQTVALLADTTINFGNGPTQVRLLMCTGTLIAPDVVLTAAHCIEPDLLGNPDQLDYYISFQEDLSAYTNPDNSEPLPSDALLVRKVVKHESFDISGLPDDGLSNFHDIGLVFLESPIADLEPAIVMTPEESADLSVGDEVQIAGWGRRTVDDSDQVGEKYCATTNIFEIGDFEMQVGREIDTARKCHGDSGGPTYITIDSPHDRGDRVIGITSRAYDIAANCGIGGVDTLPSAWYQWIDNTMSELCASEERSWCDVPGVIPPGFYDEKEDEGGCSTTNGNAAGASFTLLLLCLAAARRRRASSEF